MTTIFGKIIRGELPCDKVFENDHVIAFKDIYPKAEIHILIVPKKEIKNLQALEASDYFLLGEIAFAAQYIAKKYGVEEAYKLWTNNGIGGGQVVFHLHFHFLAGKSLESVNLP